MYDETTNTDGTAVDSSEQNLLLDVRALSGVIVLSARGVLDAMTAHLLFDAIASGLNESADGLVVDLSELDFLASAGMTVLLEGNQAARHSEKGFGVVADGPSTSRPIKLMGLDQEFSLHATLNETR